MMTKKITKLRAVGALLASVVSTSAMDLQIDSQRPASTPETKDCYIEKYWLLTQIGEQVCGEKIFPKEINLLILELQYYLPFTISFPSIEKVQLAVNQAAETNSPNIYVQNGEGFTFIGKIRSNTRFEPIKFNFLRISHITPKYDAVFFDPIEILLQYVYTDTRRPAYNFELIANNSQFNLSKMNIYNKSPHCLREADGESGIQTGIMVSSYNPKNADDVEIICERSAQRNETTKNILDGSRGNTSYYFPFADITDLTTYERSK